MIGKKMALSVLDELTRACKSSLPETEEEESEEDRQNANTNCLCLLEDLDNAVHECGNPQEPLEECCKHDSADDGNVNDLV
jgi:hypothetical protein